MREHGSDYFENSRQATYIQHEYARRNPFEFAGYSEHCWGITVILMIENYRTGLIWDIVRRCTYVTAGLRRAGFRGGWLGE